MNKLFYKSALLLLSSIGLLFTSCTRDDIGTFSSVDISKYPITFTVQAKNLATKSGDTLVYNTRNVLSSEYLASYGGEDLYLTTIEEDWALDMSDTASLALSTKGSVITTANITDYDIAVMLYSHADGADISKWQLCSNGEGSKNGVMRARFSQQLQKWLITDGSIFWPNTGNKKAHFLAVAPYESTGGLTIVAEDATNPMLEFIQNSVPGENMLGKYSQTDLLVADNAVPDNPTFDKISQKLTFSHALTGIRFMVEKELNLERIDIHGVPMRGYLDLATNSWTNLRCSEYSIFEESGDMSLIKESTTADYSLLDETYTIFALPSTGLPNGVLQEDAKLKIRTTDGKTLTYSIANQEYKAGKMITYKISKKPEEPGKYVFSVIPPDDISALEMLDHTTYNTSTTTIVQSYRLDNEGQKYPVDWILDGVYLDYNSAVNKDYTGLQPSISTADEVGGIILHTTSSSSSAPLNDPTLYQFRFSYRRGPERKYLFENTRIGESRNQRIAQALVQGSADTPVNLADNYSISNIVGETTGNTYIVNGPGYYKFPLIMGSSRMPAHDFPAFRNYLNNEIPANFSLADGGKTPYYAILSRATYDFIETKGNDPSTKFEGSNEDITEWCLVGVNHGVNGISYTPNNDTYWANFYIPKEKCVKQGLATIVIMDIDKNIMWSYLIWLTDYQISLNHFGEVYPEEDSPSIDYIPIINEQGQEDRIGTRQMMSRDLGYIDPDTEITLSYSKGWIRYLRFEQEGSNNYAILTVGMPNGTYRWDIKQDAFSPVWQWGTPFALFDKSFGGKDTEWRGFHSDTPILDPRNTIEATMPNIIKNAYRITLGNPYKENRYSYNSHYLWDLNLTDFSDDQAADVYFFSNNILYKAHYTFKTIYDPCPAGFSVPPYQMTRVFAKDKEANGKFAPYWSLSYNFDFSIQTELYGGGTPNARESYYGYYVNYYVKPTKILEYNDPSVGTVTFRNKHTSYFYAQSRNQHVRNSYGPDRASVFIWRSVFVVNPDNMEYSTPLEDDDIGKKIRDLGPEWFISRGKQSSNVAHIRPLYQH